MLASLHDEEHGLLELIVERLEPVELLRLAATAAWLRPYALRAADGRVRKLIAGDRRVSRWRREAYAPGVAAADTAAAAAAAITATTAAAAAAAAVAAAGGGSGGVPTVGVLREALHIDRAMCFLERLSGRYRIDDELVLDVSPAGDFANYSTHGITADTAGHCFRGVLTVAGMICRKGLSHPLFLLDRWYRQHFTSSAD